MNINKYKRLQEKAKTLGKQLLIEEVAIDLAKSGVIYESLDTPMVFKEDVNGISGTCRGVLRNVPVTRFIENKNGRIYPRKLWEIVSQKKVFEGSYCYADHADDDNSVKNITGIWGPLKIGEKTANADLFLVGENGSHMLEVAQAPYGKVGLSTVGFGEFSESDDKTVDPESFEYSNCDWVSEPSQEVYATKENLLMPPNNVTKSEKSEYEPDAQFDQEPQKSNNFENVNTNNKDNILKENSVLSDKKEVFNMNENLQKASFKNQINRTLKEAVKKENFLEAIDELKGLDIPEEFIDLKEKVSVTIDSLQVKLDEQIQNAKKSLAEKESSVTELKAKLEESEKTIVAMKEKFDKIKSVLQKNDIKELKDVSALKESLNNMAFDLKAMKEEKTKLEANLKIYEEDTNYRDYDLKRYAEDLDKATKKIKFIMSERKDMLSDINEYERRLKHAEKYILNLRNRLKEEGVEDDEIEQLGEVDDSELEGSKKEEDTELETVEGQATTDQVDTLNSPIVPIPSVNSDSKANADVQNLGEEDETIEDEPIMTEEDLDPAPFNGIEEEDDEIMGGSSEKDPVVEEDENPFDGSKKEEEDETVIGSSKKEEKVKFQFSAIDPKKTKVKEIKKQPSINKDLVEFFEAQVKKHPFIADFKKEILGAKSLIQAVDMIDELKEKTHSKDQVVKFKESSQVKPTWIPKGRF